MAEYNITITTGAQGATGQGVQAGGTTGQFLRKATNTDFDTEWADSSATINTINDILDVVITSPSENQVLTWVADEWVNQTPSGGTWGTITGTLSNQTDLQSALNAKLEDLTAESIGTLSDVTFGSPGPSSGQILTYNVGGYWEAQDAPVSAVWGNITGTLSNQTDLQSALDAKAASSHTHLMADITDSTWITPTSTSTLTNKTITDYTNTVYADQVHYRIKATEGIAKGQAVSFVGYNAGENAIEVQLCNNTTDVAIGISAQALTTGNFGNIVANGLLEGINTSSYAEGTILYVNGSGTLTATEPASGFAQPIAFVLRQDAVNGTIQINADYPKQDTADIRGISSYMQTVLDDTSATAAHTTLDLNTYYVNVSQKAAANGVATLGATSRVPTAQLGTGTADNTKFLRGDGTWSTPAGAGAGIGALTFYTADGSQDDIDLSANTTMDSLTLTTELDMNATADFRVGSAFGWRDLFAPMLMGGSADPTLNVFRDNVRAYDCPNNQSKEWFVNFHIDHDYAGGTKVYPHVHFTVNHATAAGTVRIGIEYTVAKGHAQATGSTFGATTTKYIEVAVNGVTDQYKHFVAELSDADAIPSTLIEPDSVIMIRCFTDTGHANYTYTDSIYVIQTDCHYNIGKFATPNKAPDFYA